MVDKEMLSAISGLLDEKLEGLITDIAGLKKDVSVLKKDVSVLKKDMHYVKIVQLENNVIPRLSTIESCYLDTFQRYKERTEQFDQMTEDIGVLKSVVSDHSENWKEFQDRRVK